MTISTNGRDIESLTWTRFSKKRPHRRENSAQLATFARAPGSAWIVLENHCNVCISDLPQHSQCRGDVDDIEDDFESLLEDDPDGLYNEAEIPDPPVTYINGRRVLTMCTAMESTNCQHHSVGVPTLRRRISNC